MPTQTETQTQSATTCPDGQLQFPEFDTVVTPQGDGSYRVRPVLVARGRRISAAEAASILSCATRTVFDMICDPDLRERLGVRQRAAGCKVTLDRAAVEKLAGEDWRA